MTTKICCFLDLFLVMGNFCADITFIQHSTIKRIIIVWLDINTIVCSRLSVWCFTIYYNLTRQFVLVYSAFLYNVYTTISTITYDSIIKLYETIIIIRDIWIRFLEKLLTHSTLEQRKVFIYCRYNGLDQIVFR